MITLQRRHRQVKKKRSRKYRFMSLCILLLFFTGLAMILYPIWQDYQSRQQQILLLTEWDIFQGESTQEDATLLEFLDDSIPTLQLDNGQIMIGTISVESIQLREPILHETTEESLKHGIGNVVPERFPGIKGSNFVLAGHRSHTYGKQFNRLGELSLGDEINIQFNGEDYTYWVTQTFIVSPNDLSVLDVPTVGEELTLITCHPMYNPTHRLIVKARAVTSTSYY